MSLMDFLIKTKDSVLDALFPSNYKCIFCGRDIPDFDNRPYCDECSVLDIFNNGNRCKHCDMQIHEDNIVCDVCAKHKRYFETAFCPLVHADIARSSIIKFKSDNARYLAKPFAKLIFDRIKTSEIKVDMVIPVPLHEKNLRKRGYNQAALLGSELAKMLDCEMRDDIVTKDEFTANQKDLPYIERIKNIENCFNLRDKTAIKSKNLLIVDDIMTTGASLNAVAKLLKPHASHIYVCAIARNMPKDKKERE